MLDFYFKDIVQWIKSDKRSLTWTTIYKNWEEDEYQEYLFCLLLPQKLITDFTKHPSWSLNINSLKPDYSHYSEKDPKYYRWGIESKYEPIVYQQFYNNIYPTKIEIIEEFLQFFNLYFDYKNKLYISVDISSEQNEVVKIINQNNNLEIKVKTDFLRRFLYAKKMVLGFQLDYFRKSSKTLSEQNLNEKIIIDEYTKSFNYNINFKEYSFMDKYKSDSRLLAKTILSGYESQNIQTDFEKLNSKKCEDFIVDINHENGDHIFENCKKSEFEKSNYGYFTPVFFDREVLLKYYNNPNLYTIEDGSIFHKGSWRLYIDNNNYDYIIVYLGDLKTIPNKEQIYWKSFNITPQSNVNNRRFSIDFLSSYYDPEIEDLKFKKKYVELNEIWEQRFGFKLFSDFNEQDVHCFKTLRIPLKNDSVELDTLILNLCKILVDYLNIKSINNYLDNEQKNLRTIEKFEIFLVKNEFENASEIISFFKTIQRLRSTGSAHRKNSDYQKILKDLGYKDLDEKNTFKSILQKALNSIDILRNNIQK